MTRFNNEIDTLSLPGPPLAWHYHVLFLRHVVLQWYRNDVRRFS